MKNLILRSSLAGLFISIGCIVNMKIGGVPGAVLFSFGLLSVVHYKLALYTGTAGFINNTKTDWTNLGIILVFNCFACFLLSLCFPDLREIGENICRKRLELGYLPNFVGAICCGLIMTTAVEHGREKNWLPLLFGVPLFILAGFNHSIANFFYYSYTPSFEIWGIWIFEVIGNLIGCNIPRFTKGS